MEKPTMLFVVHRSFRNDELRINGIRYSSMYPP